MEFRRRLTKANPVLPPIATAANTASPPPGSAPFRLRGPKRTPRPRSTAELCAPSHAAPPHRAPHLRSSRGAGGEGRTAALSAAFSPGPSAEGVTAAPCAPPCAPTHPTATAAPTAAACAGPAASAPQPPPPGRPGSPAERPPSAPAEGRVSTKRPEVSGEKAEVGRGEADVSGRKVGVSAERPEVSSEGPELCAEGPEVHCRERRVARKRCAERRGVREGGGAALGERRGRAVGALPPLRHHRVHPGVPNFISPPLLPLWRQSPHPFVLPTVPPSWFCPHSPTPRPTPSSSSQGTGDAGTHPPMAQRPPPHAPPPAAAPCLAPSPRTHSGMEAAADGVAPELHEGGTAMARRWGWGEGGRAGGHWGGHGRMGAGRNAAAQSTEPTLTSPNPSTPTRCCIWRSRSRSPAPSLSPAPPR